MWYAGLKKGSRECCSGDPIAWESCWWWRRSFEEVLVDVVVVAVCGLELQWCMVMLSNARSNGWLLMCRVSR